MAPPVATAKSDGVSELRAPPATFLIPLDKAFYICFASHILAALYAPIQDCDETFNYWEPLHYLTHGYGLQTWEYSPNYSIRSWTYILLHAFPVKATALLGRSKVFQFYTLRTILAFFCAATELRLYSAISRNINPRVSAWYLIIVATTPGIYQACSAFLPSSFAMYTSTLGLTAFLDQRGGPKTVQGIMWFAVGALLGWPFAGALIVPFVVKDWMTAIRWNEISDTFSRYLQGATSSFIALGLQTVIDSIFYRRISIVPFSIVLYNVFSGDDRGPNIFGTEPWDFYVRNLLLNFNVWFVLAIGVIPLLVMHTAFRHSANTSGLLKWVTFVLPFYLWFAIFTSQPHKEERFMYPAYPFLAFNAAVGLHVIVDLIGNANPSTIVGKVPSQIKLAAIISVAVSTVFLGWLRIRGIGTAYGAPLQVYEALTTQTNISSLDNICVGKEWYRFPSSFFLPNRAHAKFIKSEFDGLLPGEFPELGDGLNVMKGTWLIPAGMNDRNEEDLNKYTEIDECTYLVDFTGPSTIPSEVEPDYTQSAQWDEVFCAPFMDADATPALARMIWLPDLSILPQRYRRTWGKYCLLRRR